MTGSNATVYEFDIPEARPADIPTVAFRINGEDFVLRQPKMSIAMGMVQLTEQQDEYTAADFGIRLSHLMWGFVSYVEAVPPEPLTIPDPDDPKGEPIPNPVAGRLRGRGRLLQRLNSPDDAMDIMDLEPMFRQMVTVMFDRPTGPSPASPDEQRDGGTDSEAATPERPAKTSGTSRRPSSSPRAKTSPAKSSKPA